MGKEFYSDAISLLKSISRGNQSSRKVLGLSISRSKGKKISGSNRRGGSRNVAAPQRGQNQPARKP